jgi:hypothetical protein
MLRVYRTGSLKTVARELAKYNLDLVAVYCVRWEDGGGEPANRPKIGNDSLREIINDNGGWICKSQAHQKSNCQKSTVFPHRIIHKYTWISLMRKHVT